MTPLTSGAKMVDRDERGRILKGVILNPHGRPKGSTSLKTFARDFLVGLSDEDKAKWLAAIDPEIVWRMAEGNPHSTSDETVKHIIPTPIMTLDSVDKIEKTGVITPQIENGK